MEDNFNAAGTAEQTEPHSDAQERVVDALESQTGGGYAALDGREDVVDPQEEGGDTGTDADGANQQTHRQTREDNAAIRAARIAARREAEAEIARRTDEDIAASGVVNPYTNKPFASMKEFRDYGKSMRQAEIKRLAKESGRSEEEVADELADKEFVRQERRKRAQEDEQRRERERQQDFIRRDVQDFVKRHPNVDLEKLENNKSFLKYCGSRFGKEPLGDLYDAYLDIVGEAGQAAVAKQADRSDRSTGGGSTGGPTMTPSQQKALDAWNAANPDMAMTAKEFLTRKN